MTSDWQPIGFKGSTTITQTVAKVESFILRGINFQKMKHLATLVICYVFRFRVPFKNVTLIIPLSAYLQATCHTCAIQGSHHNSFAFITQKIYQ